MLPSEIRFSQNHIANTFTEGDNLHSVIDSISRGSKTIQEFLPMEVAFARGQWYTANNRTLYVCRVLEYEGKLREVRVKEVSLSLFR